MFRLITQDEQRAYIDERAKTKHGAKISNHKGKKQQRSSTRSTPIHLDPLQFELDSAHFKDEQDLPVPQIGFDDVETEARGVSCSL